MTDFEPPRTWADDISVGTIVSFRFPKAGEHNGTPAASPCLVTKVRYRAGKCWIELAYGRTETPPANHETQPIAEAATHSMRSRHERRVSFHLRKRIIVSPSNSGFVYGNRRTPVLGRLQIPRVQSSQLRQASLAHSYGTPVPANIDAAPEVH